MKNLLQILIIILLTPACKLKHNDEIPDIKILLEAKDDSGRLKKKVISGYIAGEDFYLTIQNFDSSENIISEYGALPYGSKYKTTYKWDSKGRVIEKLEYKFITGEFENYHDGEYKHYEIQDTLSDFNNGKISRKILFQYDNEQNLIREKEYQLSYDSLKMKGNYVLILDTTYKNTGHNER